MKAQKQDQNELAACFMRIERSGETLEGVANGMFAPLKAKKIKTLEQFNAEVTSAYEINGWSRKAGRPAADAAKEKSAPEAVQVYVSRFRKAYRLKLNVISFVTIGALRTAMLKKTSVSHQAAKRPPELKGIQLSSENSLIGALFHDMPALWQRLPDDKKDMFYRQIEKVYNQYLKSAPPDLVKAAA